MTKQIERKKHEIDASGKPCGRLAVEVANLLRGRGKTEFVYERDVGDIVCVYNLKNIKFTGRKLENKKYFTHSGYIGRLKERTLKEALQEDPKFVFRHAVTGMLPKNRLQPAWLKRLKLYEGVLDDKGQ